MPLIYGKSDKARSENIGREIEHGKSPAQAAAIAYSIQRKERNKAKGGMMQCAHGSDDGSCNTCMAEGGMAHAEDDYDPEEEPMPKENMAAEDEDKMLLEMVMKGEPEDEIGKYSEGGKVANEDTPEAEFMPNQFDDLALRDDLEADYTGANSGDEIGDEQEDDDRKKVLDMIMRSRAKKDKMPRPA